MAVAARWPARVAGLVISEEYFLTGRDEGFYHDTKRIVDNVAFSWIGPVFFVHLGAQLQLKLNLLLSILGNLDLARGAWREGRSPGRALDDLEAAAERATDLARAMVTQYGMSPLGPIAFGENEETLFLGREVTRHQPHSPATIERIDVEIEKIVQESLGRAEKLLHENSDKLKIIAEALIKYESLKVAEVELHLEGGDLEQYRASKRPPTPPAEPTDQAPNEAEEKKPDSLPQKSSP